MLLVVYVYCSGGSNDLGNEVLFVRLAWDCHAGFVEDVLELNDLEGFPVRRCVSKRGRQREKGTDSLASMAGWWWRVGKEVSACGSGKGRGGRKRDADQ